MPRHQSLHVASLLLVALLAVTTTLTVGVAAAEATGACAALASCRACTSVPGCGYCAYYGGYQSDVQPLCVNLTSIEARACATQSDLGTFFAESTECTAEPAEASATSGSIVLIILAMIAGAVLPFLPWCTPRKGSAGTEESRRTFNARPLRWTIIVLLFASVGLLATGLALDSWSIATIPAFGAQVEPQQSTFGVYGERVGTLGDLYGNKRNHTYEDECFGDSWQTNFAINLVDAPTTRLAPRTCAVKRAGAILTFAVSLIAIVLTAVGVGHSIPGLFASKPVRCHTECCVEEEAGCCRRLCFLVCCVVCCCSTPSRVHDFDLTNAKWSRYRLSASCVALLTWIATFLIIRSSRPNVELAGVSFILLAAATACFAIVAAFYHYIVTHTGDSMKHLLQPGNPATYATTLDVAVAETRGSRHLHDTTGVLLEFAQPRSEIMQEP